MQIFLEYLKVFAVGGALCAIGQILIDRTNLTPGRILVSFVTAGVILSAIGIYKPIADFAGAGASVPLTGFGHALAEGAREGVKEKGLLGAFTGGVTRTAGGIAAAVIFGYLCALLAKPRAKT
ncbi:MAG: stage V sporulation protein AE [Clostridia bacterium]|jgi:stage V sporulation protein AE|nr:stage V sporulation protein AE [Clostridia bacterium]